MKTSVALCTYNGEQYIEQQLLSIINQEEAVDEIVVSDDGSDDGTIAIVRRIAADHPQVSWTIIEHTHNAGVTKNFEEAISRCSGDIIFLSDQDDVWLPNKVSTICSYFENYPTKSVVFTDAELIDGEGKQISLSTLLDAINFSPYLSLWNAGAEFEIFNYHNRATGATMALRKSFFDKLPPFINNRDYLHDYQLALAAILSNAMGLITQALIQYRLHGKNVVGVRKDSRIYQADADIAQANPALYTEPYPLNSYVLFLQEQMHIEPPYIYKKRIEKYATLSGKLWLIWHMSGYKKRYKQYWKSFFRSDITYGIIKR